MTCKCTHKHVHTLYMYLYKVCIMKCMYYSYLVNGLWGVNVDSCGTIHSPIINMSSDFLPRPICNVRWLISNEKRYKSY